MNIDKNLLIPFATTLLCWGVALKRHKVHYNSAEKWLGWKVTRLIFGAILTFLLYHRVADNLQTRLLLRIDRDQFLSIQLGETDFGWKPQCFNVLFPTSECAKQHYKETVTVHLATPKAEQTVSLLDSNLELYRLAEIIPGLMRVNETFCIGHGHAVTGLRLGHRKRQVTKRKYRMCVVGDGLCFYHAVSYHYQEGENPLNAVRILADLTEMLKEKADMKCPSLIAEAAKVNMKVGKYIDKIAENQLCPGNYEHQLVACKYGFDYVIRKGSGIHSSYLVGHKRLIELEYRKSSLLSVGHVDLLLPRLPGFINTFRFHQSCIKIGKTFRTDLCSTNANRLNNLNLDVQIWARKTAKVCSWYQHQQRVAYFQTRLNSELRQEIKVPGRGAVSKSVTGNSPGLRTGSSFCPRKAPQMSFVLNRYISQTELLMLPAWAFSVPLSDPDREMRNRTISLKKTISPYTLMQAKVMLRHREHELASSVRQAIHKENVKISQEHDGYKPKRKIGQRNLKAVSKQEYPALTNLKPACTKFCNNSHDNTICEPRKQENIEPRAMAPSKNPTAVKAPLPGLPAVNIVVRVFQLEIRKVPIQVTSRSDFNGSDVLVLIQDFGLPFDTVLSFNHILTHRGVRTLPSEMFQASCNKIKVEK